MAVGHLLVVLAVVDPVAVNLVEVSQAVNPVEENLAEVDLVVKNRVL